jgi:hypothetical protein
MLENSERAIQNGQSKETGNIGYTRRRKTKHKHNAICVGHYFKQTNTNNLNKTTGGKNEPNIVFKYILFFLVDQHYTNKEIVTYLYKLLKLHNIIQGKRDFIYQSNSEANNSTSLI